MNEKYQGIIARYKKYLPINSKTPVVTILEGNTPLIPAPAVSAFLGKRFELYLKYEGLNPTGSFKDRGMTVAVSKAKEERQRAVICASTGNTSASAAAYAGRANLKCIVVIPEGAIALGKLAQALMHNAEVVAVKGNFDDALTLVREISSLYPVRLVNSLNPHRIEGQKTAAFEIVDVLGDAPVFHSLPVGNAGNITAYWKGYKEYYSYRKINRLPIMLGFQAKGACPIVKGKAVRKPKTIATAIRIGNPASWQKALEAKAESGGVIDAVTDREIVSAYKLLAKYEGVFVEPASSASIAGLFKLNKEGYFKRFINSFGKITIVATLTGHGLKDPQLAIKKVKSPKVVTPTVQSVVKAARIQSL
ncbi:MAG: threonine synthase [Candidatus Omnitrophota bacterium]